MWITRTGPAIVGCAAAVLAASSSRAQTASRQTPDLLLPAVTTEVVRIDVVVIEKGGKPRQGLTAQDFVVLEDGEPQQIAQFESFVSAPPAAAPSAAPIPKDAGEDLEEEPPARATPPRRYVVLAVDDLHIEASNLLRVRKAMDRFLEREVGPEDQIAIVTTSGTRGLYQEFTDDRHALRRSIARLSVQDRTPVSSGVPFITEYQAEQIDRGDAEALRVAVEEVILSGLFQDAASAEPVARAAARAVLAESIHSSRLTLETLDGVVRSLSELRGRKVLVLVSDGFLFGIGATATAGFDIRRISDAGTRAGVVIYALDSGGLVATPSSRSASSRMPMVVSTFSARDILLRESEHATRDAMNALAGETGGFLVQGTNDLGAGLRRILKDSETFYLIAYESTNPKRDGAFRKIEVRLPGQRDLRVRTRRGYFAPDDGKRRRKASPSEPAPTGTATVADAAGSPKAEDPPESDLGKALTALAPFGGVPVRLSADFVSVDEAVPQVVVSAYVDLKGLFFVRSGDRHVATVDAAATVFDESGAVVGSLEPERATLNLSDSGYEQALRVGLRFQKAAPLKPGRYRVRLAAREQNEGKVGTATQWVRVPDLSTGKLTLSSLFLLEKDDSKGEPPAVAQDVAQDVALRGTQALRRYKRGDTLYVQNFAYNPKRDASGAAKLVSQAEIWRGGVLLASSAPEELALGAQGEPPVAHTRSIKLDPFAPGEYEVRIVVTDHNANSLTSRRAAFTIE